MTRVDPGWELEPSGGAAHRSRCCQLCSRHRKRIQGGSRGINAPTSSPVLSSPVSASYWSVTNISEWTHLSACPGKGGGQRRTEMDEWSDRASGETRICWSVNLSICLSVYHLSIHFKTMSYIGHYHYLHKVSYRIFVLNYIHIYSIFMATWYSRVGDTWTSLMLTQLIYFHIVFSYYLLMIDRQRCPFELFLRMIL